MAIYGVGSKWNDQELKRQFFDEHKFILGWNENSAKDLYSFVASLKVGDILYIKSNAPGSRKIKVKGIGIITKNFIGCVNSGEFTESVSDWQTLFIRVSWVMQDEFEIEIAENEGKLTNVRAATMYEEFLPEVQEILINKLISSV